MDADLIVKGATSLDGLLAGLFVGSCMMEHAARTLPAQHWIAYNRAKDAVYGPAMPVVFSATLASSAAVAWLSGRAGQGFATALLLGAGAITASVHLPLNRQFRSWTCPGHPQNWADARRRWRIWNVARCALAVAAFGAATFG